MNKNTWALIVFLFVVCRLFAQSPAIDEVIVTPSKEIYDLLQDKKGFIWIADELGVRRYDGVTFTSFTHPQQSSLSMTDLAEDKQGRIWCHNFNGQIFYIEHEQMYLLNSYNAASERAFPRIAICGDELLATTSKGLFVCDTKNLKCRYITTPVAGGTNSICIVNDRAVLHSDSGWYTYRKDSRLIRLPPIEVPYANLTREDFTLQPAANGDTIYAITNPGALLISFTFSDNQLKLQHIVQCSSYENAVTIDSGEAWIHTKTESRSLTSGKKIKGFNLSCILKDKDGDTWYSSLDKGLLVSYAHQPWNIIKDSALKKDDFIKSMKQSDEYFVRGTQLGLLLVQDKKLNTTKQYMLPAGAGGVDRIELLPKNIFLIASSIGIYLLNPAKGKLQCLQKLLTAKDMDINNDVLYLGTSRGLLQVKIDTATGIVPPVEFKPILRGEIRCRAVRYNTETHTLWMAYNDGLYEWNNNRLEPVLYNGEHIYASSLEYRKGKIYAGTFSGNLLIIREEDTNKYKFQQYTFNSAVVRMKLYDSHLWIFNASGLHAFDTDKEEFIYNQSLPYLNGNNVWDATEVVQDVYLAAIGQLYKISMQQAAKTQPPSLYLRYVSINNQDTIFNNGVRLPYNKNNLSFYIAAPWFNRNNNVSIRYKLTSTNDHNADAEQWYDLEDNERIIQLNVLAPGDYTLTIQAGINDNYQTASAPLMYSFTITKPWYNQWWFYSLTALILAVVLYCLYIYRINQLLKLERLRREISSNLHDEVGSTVSSINIYTQLIKKGKHSEEYIDMIQANTVQVINSLDELVWNINPKYDTLEQLINKMKFFAIPFLNDNNIVCHFDVTVEKQKKTLPPEVRTDFYLVLKESVNNIVKHAQCSRCDIYISQKGKFLRMSIKDNGKGFDISTAAMHRNGLTTMQYRAKKLKGDLNIISKSGNGTEITLSCNISNLL
jgi:signal transduction histidine kinase/ligand-binding sensor domain-containing protein